VRSPLFVRIRLGMIALTRMCPRASPVAASWEKVACPTWEASKAASIRSWTK